MSVYSCSYRTVHSLCSQADIHGVLCKMLQVSVSHIMQQMIKYIHLSVSYTFNMSDHFAVPVSDCPFTTTPSPTFIISWLRERLGVHLSRWGGSNSAIIVDHETWRKMSFQKNPDVSMLWHCCHPCHSQQQQLPVVSCGRYQEPTSRNQQAYHG